MAGFPADQLLAVVTDAAAGRRGVAAERHQQGGLAGAIGTDKGHNLTLLHVQTYPVQRLDLAVEGIDVSERDRKSTRLNSSHVRISYAVFCLKKKRRTTTSMWSSTP